MIREELRRKTDQCRVIACGLNSQATANARLDLLCYSFGVQVCACYVVESLLARTRSSLQNNFSYL